MCDFFRLIPSSFRCQAPDETIADDYALTTTHAKVLLADLYVAAKSAGRDAERSTHFLSATRETMLATLRGLHERHGSVRAYLTNVGISEAKLEVLEGRWLTPANL